jgi:hypothetical protein
LGWWLIQRFVSWVAWEGKVWLFFKVRRWDFLNFPRNFFWWCEMGWLEKGVGYIYIYCPSFFFDMVT